VTEKAVWHVVRRYARKADSRGSHLTISAGHVPALPMAKWVYEKASDAFALAFSIAISDASTPNTSKPCCESQTVLWPVLQPMSNARHGAMGNRRGGLHKIEIGLANAPRGKAFSVALLKRS